MNRFLLESLVGLWGACRGALPGGLPPLHLAYLRSGPPAVSHQGAADAALIHAGARPTWKVRWSTLRRCIWEVGSLDFFRSHRSVECCSTHTDTHRTHPTRHPSHQHPRPVLS